MLLKGSWDLVTTLRLLRGLGALGFGGYGLGSHYEGPGASGFRVKLCRG